MKSTRSERLVWAAWATLALVYAFFFVQETSAGLLANDAAKYALNIPYPHPPFGRWLMLASQAWFGANAFAARLPSLVAELLAIFLFLRTASLEQGRGWRELAPLFLLALSPAFLLWVGQGYQTSFVLLAVGLIAFGTTKKTDARLAWVTAGYLLAIWTQLQGALLLPAVLLFFWSEWRAGSFRLRMDDASSWLFANVIAHTFLVGLWLVGSPLAVADALQLAGSSVGFTQKAAGFVAADFFPLAILLVALNVAHLYRWWKEQRLAVSTGAILLSSFLFLAYLFSNHASYYLPYLFALCFWNVIELRPATKRSSALLIVVIAFLVGTEAYLFGPRLARIPDDRRVETAALRERLSGHESVMALGFYGYEEAFRLGRSFVRFAGDPRVREDVDAVVVFRSATLSDHERAFLAEFARRETFGSASVYAR